MKIFRLLLFPFSLLYGIIIFFRNKLYDWNIFKSTSFDIPIISVGNLEVGGSGKTPMVEYLILLLKNDFNLSTLSRGYGRKTKGFRWVKPDDDALETGDEPLQIAKKYKDINVAVCEDRVFGINKIKQTNDLILMDDAFQHRAVKPGLSILLFDYHQIQKPKLLLPAGDYREDFCERKRANIIVVTKCPPNLSSAKRQKIKAHIKPFEHQELFFSFIKYDEQLQKISSFDKLNIAQITAETTVILLTGIAKTEPLITEIKKYTPKIIHHAYADHHVFTQKNMLKLATDFNELKSVKKIIITTEKDAVRLNTTQFDNILKDLPIYKLPITVGFINNQQEEFNKSIKNYAKQYI
ncbi:tetraacyldisaccharide 4'-kinase [Pedobacter psychrophilus]|uniref:Tetraacyldisaccharide 4'-kinase n=1 Tax=Pedobacter psychrophilus TaxID=1826909 RepID=A0A179DC38_9SPHI|nr:tetraacyldisaccharide 4'-kinase [Pedobacter psychrophilus]OAQ38260.1 tetraacyldisaccharide 4'-kinase [Pedobacter psychrophilus]